MNAIFVGNDRYLLKKEARLWLNKNMPKANECNPIVFDGVSSEFNWEHVFEEIQTISFFDEYKLIMLINPPGFSSASTMSDGQLKTYTKMINQLPFEVILLVLVEANKLDKRLKIVAPLLEKGPLILVSSLSPKQFEQFVIEQCKIRSLTLSPAVLEELIHRLPMQVDLCLIELDKMANYPFPLDQRLINLMIARPLEENVFELSKAIVSKNLKKALTIYKDFKMLKQDPVSLLPAIAWQLRLMFQILICQEEYYTYAQIVERLSENEFSIKRTMEYTQLTSSERVGDLLEALAKLDQKIKSGLIEKHLGFELFVIEATR